MKARAPGKVVLSGAYSVLEGAPALVAAVDRYVVADTDRTAERISEEVAAAVRLGHLSRAPWFDASALRAEAPDSDGASRKLGLGSSAAIVVACLGACLLEDAVEDPQLVSAVLPAAIEAHRLAQGGGSGIDVAASCFGGIVACRRATATGDLEILPTTLPDGLMLEVFAAKTSASTAQLLGLVQRFAAARPERYRQLLSEAGAGAEQAIDAPSAAQWIAAAERQLAALAELGAAASASIVTDSVLALGALARRSDAYFGPAGAGGGDIALYAGPAPSSSDFRARARAAGLCPLALELGARGLHRLSS